MNTPLFIATRYLLAKKSHNLINIITWISIVGIGVASFALIVVLSAFNGLENVISSLNSRLAPDIQVSSVVGKTIDLGLFPSEDVVGLQDVEYVIPTITEDALFRANDKQHIGQVKGVGSDYEKVSRLGEVVFNQEALSLSDGGYDFAIPGAGVAWYLGINAYDPYSVVRVYVPKRGNASLMSLESSFNSGALTVQSVFSTEQEMDENTVLVPYEWLSELLGYDGKATDVELFLSRQGDVDRVKKELKTLLGDGYMVKDQREQQETLYKIMHSEKWAVYAILTFILILATFNVVGSLSMLMIEKRKDTEILRAMGADKNLLGRLFMNEGLLISVSGGVLGLMLGMVVVLLQQHFGFVKFGSGGGNYIVDAYPVMLKVKDIIVVFATILMVGGVSAFFTVHHAVKKEGDSLKSNA